MAVSAQTGIELGYDMGFPLWIFSNFIQEQIAQAKAKRHSVKITTYPETDLFFHIFLMCVSHVKLGFVTYSRIAIKLILPE